MFLFYIVAWNTISAYLIALIIGLFVRWCVFFFRRYVLKKLTLLAKKTPYKRDDILLRKLSSISTLFYVVLCVYIPLQYLALSPIFSRVIYIIFLVVVVWELSNLLIQWVKYILEQTIHKKKSHEQDKMKIHLLYILAKICIYLIAWLLLLSNFWFEITPLIASLWVLWIAVAFALQKILWDVFASFSIFLDRPFEIGDFVVVGSDSGIVKTIGIKSTRIQTLQWEELIIPNAEMTGVRIHNYRKMKKRRASLSFGVVYQTSPKVLAEIPKIVQKIVEDQEFAEFSRVHFTAFGSSSLDFELVYYVTTKDFAVYRDTHQAIALQLFTVFNKKKIWFAYPTQTVYIEKN